MTLSQKTENRSRSKLWPNQHHLSAPGMSRQQPKAFYAKFYFLMLYIIIQNFMAEAIQLIRAECIFCSIGSAGYFQLQCLQIKSTLYDIFAIISFCIFFYWFKIRINKTCGKNIFNFSAFQSVRMMHFLNILNSLLKLVGGDR